MNQINDSSFTIYRNVMDTDENSINLLLIAAQTR